MRKRIAVMRADDIRMIRDVLTFVKKNNFDKASGNLCYLASVTPSYCSRLPYSLCM